MRSDAIEVQKSVTVRLLWLCLPQLLLEIARTLSTKKGRVNAFLLVRQSWGQFQNARNRPKSSVFSLQLRVARELASQRPHPPTWKIAESYGKHSFRPLCVHSQAPLPALTLGTVGAPWKVRPFLAFDGRSESGESTRISLFRCLMNGCAGFMNSLIAEVNISPVANPYRLVFFLWKNHRATRLSAPTVFYGSVWTMSGTNLSASN
jgi:hypothetical protein